MKSRLIKSAIISMTLIVAMLFSLTANAADGNSFSTIYSGLFTATKDSYFNITEDDCILTKVKHMDSGTTPFLTASNATRVFLRSDLFMAEYSSGLMTNLDGTITSFTNSVIVSTADVSLITGFFGWPTAIWVTYHDLTYMHTI